MEESNPIGPFRTVFSSSKYGKDDALMLNGLHWAVEDKKYTLKCGGSYDEAVSLCYQCSHSPDVFFPMHAYVHHPNKVTPRRVDAAFALLGMFVPGYDDGSSRDELRARYVESHPEDVEPGGHDAAIDLVYAQVTQLRERLYRRPRAAAFTSGMHGRLGSGSPVIALSDDLCKRILELSFTE